MLSTLRRSLTSTGFGVTRHDRGPPLPPHHPSCPIGVCVSGALGYRHAQKAGCGCRAAAIDSASVTQMFVPLVLLAHCGEGNFFLHCFLHVFSFFLHGLFFDPPFLHSSKAS